MTVIKRIKCYLFGVIMLLVLVCTTGRAQSGYEDKSFSDVLTAAKSGDPFAQYEIAMRYYRGWDVQSNMKTAAEWMMRSAERGHTNAQLMLGKMYLNGEGLDKNNEQAFFWLNKAAEQGEIEAQYLVGECYHYGRGVAADQIKAAEWFKKAAEKGDAKAQYYLGKLYENGQGVPLNDKEAVRWFWFAANQGHAQAQYMLAMHYATGRGVHLNYVEAYKWFNLSAAQGNPSAIDQREKIIHKMSKDQITEAQRLSIKFIPVQKIAPSPEISEISAMQDAPLQASGTGFFITTNGYLVTAYRFLQDALRIDVRTSAWTKRAKLIKFDAANDLAILKVDSTNGCLAIDSNTPVEKGQPVFTLGIVSDNLKIWAPKLGDGNIRSLSGVGEDPRFYMLNLPIQPGNVGGPLVNVEGNVVGIITIRPDEILRLKNDEKFGLAEAVKSAHLQSLLDAIPEIRKLQIDPAIGKNRKFEDSVKFATEAIVQVLVY